MKVKSWTINHFWQCHKQRHLLAFFLKNPRNHRENCPHIWKSPHPLKKLPFWGRKKVRNCLIFLYGSVTYPKCLFCKKNGFRWVNSSLGGAVKNLHPHIGGSHFALLSRHPEIRKRQSAVMHYPETKSHEGNFFGNNRAHDSGLCITTIFNFLSFLFSEMLDKTKTNLSNDVTVGFKKFDIHRKYLKHNVCQRERIKTLGSVNNHF